MAIFEKWSWIKRNWRHIIEEAEKLDLVFVGGTALNLVLFDEYRASEDIDLYNPNSKGIDNPIGRSETELLEALSERLAKKGFDVKKQKERYLQVGPSIKIDVFYDGTAYRKIEKRTVDGTHVLLFDIQTYADMKMTALLCRTNYDARDIVDLYKLHLRGDVKILFPKCECETIEHRFRERVGEIASTKQDDLLLFQSQTQRDALPFDKFNEFRRWLVEWLSGFY